MGLQETWVSLAEARPPGQECLLQVNKCFESLLCAGLRLCTVLREFSLKWGKEITDVEPSMVQMAGVGEECLRQGNLNGVLKGQ